MNTTELTAAEAARHINQGDLGAEAYATRLLNRYRETKDLHAVTWIDEERVLESARAVDQARHRGETLGPLAGVPLIVKDNIDTVGFPTSAGNNVLRRYSPRRDAPVVETLFRNGAILLAKGNMHELAAGATSSNVPFGFVCNPYDPRRIPGGSSGGTAAAIAARIAPAGLGSDTAGSVRIPSALSGTVGLRPSTGGARKRFCGQGVVPLSCDLDTIGPIARTVGDVALLNSVITGRPAPVSAALQGLRIGIPRPMYWDGLDCGVTEVMESGLTKLRESGVVFVDVDTTAINELAARVFDILLNAGFQDDLAVFLGKNAPDIAASQVIAGILSKDVTVVFELMRGHEIPPELLVQARGPLRDELRRQYAQMFRTNGIAAIAFPTEPIVAPLIKAEGDFGDDAASAMVLVRNTLPTCAIGAPGLSVPAGLSAAGLPVGIELDGLPDEDETLLSIGLAVEAVLGRIRGPPDGR